MYKKIINCYNILNNLTKNQSSHFTIVDVWYSKFKMKIFHALYSDRYHYRYY